MKYHECTKKIKKNLSRELPPLAYSILECKFILEWLTYWVLCVYCVSCICNNMWQKSLSRDTGLVTVWPCGQVTISSLTTKALSCLRHQRQLPNWCVWRLILNLKRYVCFTVDELLNIPNNTVHVHPLLEGLLSFQPIFLWTADCVLHLTRLLGGSMLVYFAIGTPSSKFLSLLLDTMCLIWKNINKTFKSMAKKTIIFWNSMLLQSFSLFRLQQQTLTNKVFVLSFCI